MPTQATAPQMDLVDLDQPSLKALMKDLKHDYALTLVNKTFWSYETFRQQNHEPRWNTNAGLWSMWMQQKVWKGTTTPRSSLPSGLVFDQIESAMPSITGAIFTQPDWFQCEAEIGGDPKEAAGIAAHLQYLLDHDKDDYGLTFRNDFEMALKSILTFGIGYLALEWDPIRKRPSISWVDNRDLYLDPGSPMPGTDYCRSVIRRSTPTVETIMSWRDNPNMNLPSDEVLWGMAQSKKWTTADTSRQIQASLLGVNYAPGTSDRLPNPVDRQIEVLTYWSKSRVIMVLNREWVLFSDRNPYDFIPFMGAPCYSIIGQPYGLGLADAQKSNQLYAEALFNGRLDEISLALHPPRVQNARTTLTPNQQKWQPGAVFRVGNVKEDFNVMTPGGATTNIYEELGYIEDLAAKRTGISSMSSGVPQPSNANRTLGGIQAQASGSSSRLTTIVKHIEDYLIVPMLYKMYKMIQTHQEEGQQLPGRDPAGKAQAVNSNAFRRPVMFRVLASSQMMTRDKLQAQFPFVMQFLAQGPLVQGLSKVGQTVDWNEIFRFMQDSTGVGRLYTLIRPMNEQEQKALNQPSPEIQAEKEKTQADGQLRLQLAQMDEQKSLKLEQAKKQVSPMEMQAEQQKAELEMQMKQMDMQMKAQALELKKYEMQLKAQAARMDMFTKQQQAEMDMQIARTKGESEMMLGQQKVAMQGQQMDMQGQMQQKQFAMDSEHAEASHAQNMKLTKEKADFQRQQMRVKPAASNSKASDKVKKPKKD